jgi:hypothetical protein
LRWSLSFEDREELVVCVQRAGARVGSAMIDERIRDPVERRNGHPLVQVGEHVSRWIAVAAEDGEQSACEKGLTGQAELRVAQTPAFALPSPHLAFEVNCDRSPVANEVIQQKTRRPVVLHVCVEVTADQRRSRSCVDVLAADRYRLEHEQHPAREIGVGVLVSSNLPAEIVECDRLAKDFFNAWRSAA